VLPAPSPVLGLALGACAIGVLRLVGLLGVNSQPLWANYTAAESLVPIAGEALYPVSSLLIRGSALLAALLLLHRVTRGWTERRPLGVLLGIVVGGLAMHPANAYQLGLWLAQALVAGVAFTALYVFFLRFDLRLVPWAMVGMGVLGAAKMALMRGHPDAAVGSALGGLLAIGVGMWWSSELSRPLPATAAAGAAEMGSPPPVGA
jgi:hypothetical protein